jgi:DNA polymerase
LKIGKAIMSTFKAQQNSSIQELLLFYKEVGAEFVEINKDLLETKKNKSKNRYISKPEKKVEPPLKIRDSLDIINKEILNCSLCPLHKTKKKFVVGAGSTSPDIFFIGEGPGEQEDNTGVPFVGDAGQLLDKIIEKMNHNRNSVFISNIVKCRPPQNRVPNIDEAKACLPYLRRQISILKPKVIVCLGKTATNFLLGKELYITKVRGTQFEYNQIPVIPTFHPSYILHQRSKENISKAKWDVWSDMQKVLDILKKNS